MRTAITPLCRAHRAGMWHPLSYIWTCSEAACIPGRVLLKDRNPLPPTPAFPYLCPSQALDNSWKSLWAAGIPWQQGWGSFLAPCPTFQQAPSQTGQSHLPSFSSQRSLPSLGTPRPLPQQQSGDSKAPLLPRCSTGNLTQPLSGLLQTPPAHGCDHG